MAQSIHDWICFLVISITLSLSTIKHLCCGNVFLVQLIDKPRHRSSVNEMCVMGSGLCAVTPWGICISWRFNGVKLFYILKRYFLPQFLFTLLLVLAAFQGDE